MPGKSKIKNGKWKNQKYPIATKQKTTKTKKMTRKPQNLTDNTLSHSLGGANIAGRHRRGLSTGASIVALRRPSYWPVQKKFTESGDQTSTSTFLPIPTLKRVIDRFALPLRFFFYIHFVACWFDRFKDGYTKILSDCIAPRTDIHNERQPN